MSAKEPDFDEEAPEIFDFLEELQGDTESGRTHPLSHYLPRYPGFEEAISREFLSHRTPPSRDEVLPEQPAADADIGPYKVEKELGRGGQGVVYLAEDTRISRRVALKVLPPAALLLSADRKARLRREAEVISRLEHPGICGIYDAEISGDLAYIAMHFIEGDTLGALIAHQGRVRTGVVEGTTPALGPVLYPENEAELFRLLEFFELAARAMHAAHEVGVVHRDIKPGNLMVTPSGGPVWLDFGQARDTEAAGAQLTMSGEVFGTPSYMSPEQLTGHRDALDPRTDVWALCVSLFEALTLERPFEGASTHAILFAVQTAEPRSARELNPAVTSELEVVLQTGLEKDLARRYASAAELADELARIRGYLPIHAQPASAALKFKRWYQRHPVVFVSISAVVAMLVVGLAWTLYLLKLEGEALDHALGRHLAERATTLVDEDPAAALALGIEAVELAPGYQTRSALYSALERCYLAGEFDGDPARRFRSIALSPDGSLLAAALSDGSGRLYDVTNREKVVQWNGHEGEATAVAFSADGGSVASGDSSGRVALFDVGASVVRYWTSAAAGEVLELAFCSRDSKPMLLVLSSGDGLQLVDPFDGAVLEKPTVEDLAAPPYELSSAGHELVARHVAAEAATSTPDPAEEAALLFRSDDATSEVSFLAVDLPGGVVWELRSLQNATLELEHDGTHEVLAAAFSPDGTRLAVAASRGGVKLFDVPTGRKIATFESLLQTVKLLWTPDGDHVIAQTVGSFVKVWFGRPRPDVYRLFGGGGALIEAHFTADGERAVTLAEDGLARLWSTPSSATERGPVGTLLQETRYPGGSASSVALSSRGARMAVCGDSGVWIVPCAVEPEPWLVETGPARQATFLADGERLLVVGELGSVISAEADHSPVLALASGETILVAELVESTEVVVTATAGGRLICTNCATGEELWEVLTDEDPDHGVTDLAFHPDGLEVAIARGDRTIRFRSLEDGAVTREPLGVFPPRDVDWSADGSRLLVTGPAGRGALLVKELATDQRMRASVYHDGNLLGGSFSPDGLLVMTFSEDGTIFVRDVLSGSPSVQLRGDGAPIRCASFSGGGGTLRVIAAMRDGHARIWPVDPLPAALARKPRELYGWEAAREGRLARPLEYR